MAEVAKLTETHHQMMLWLVQNPGKRLADMSAEFGYSVPWLSQIINSNIFQARLKELQNVEDVCVLADLPAKLRGLTSQAVDELAVAVDDASKDSSKLIHRTFLMEVAELGLKSLGYGPKPASAPVAPPFMQQNNTFVTVSPEVLAKAREKLLESANAIPATRELLTSNEGDLSSVQREPATLFESSFPQGEIPAGATL